MTTIVFAEADPALRTLVTYFLCSEGFTVHGVTDGVALIDQAMLVLPDLILTETALPRISGIAAIEYLRALRPTAPIPILVHSCDASTQQAVLAAGAQRFLLKPVRLDDLLDTMLDLIRTDTTRS